MGDEPQVSPPATNLFYAGYAGERALHGVSQSPCVLQSLRSYSLAQASDYNTIVAAGRHRLKPTAHNPQPIATPQMPPQPAHRKRRSHVSRLTSHVSRLAVSRLSPQMPPQPPTPLIKKSSRSDTCISSPITHHSSLITYHSQFPFPISKKYPPHRHIPVFFFKI